MSCLKLDPPVRLTYREACRKILAIIRQSLDRGVSDHWLDLICGHEMHVATILRGLQSAGEIERLGEILPGEFTWVAVEWGPSP
jgi:hypothetical protein